MEAINEWNVFEIIIIIVGFISGFVAGSWRLSQQMTRSNIVAEQNNLKLGSIEKDIKTLIEERYLERERNQNRFSEHETRITNVENNVTLIFKQIDELRGKT